MNFTDDDEIFSQAAAASLALSRAEQQVHKLAAANKCSWTRSDFISRVLPASFISSPTVLNRSFDVEYCRPPVDGDAATDVWKLVRLANASSLMMGAPVRYGFPLFCVYDAAQPIEPIGADRQLTLLLAQARVPFLLLHAFVCVEQDDHGAKSMHIITPGSELRVVLCGDYVPVKPLFTNTFLTSLLMFK